MPVSLLVDRPTMSTSPATLLDIGSGCTASPTFAVSVHGVVVQTRNDSFGRPATGIRTVTLVCVISRYESIISCCESAVPRRAHHGIERWPL